MSKNKTKKKTTSNSGKLKQKKGSSPPGSLAGRWQLYKDLASGKVFGANRSGAFAIACKMR